MAGRVDERRETAVRDGDWLDRERAQLDLTNRPLSVGGEAVGVVCAHQEAAAREPSKLR
jgi:hypothetical protein